MIVGALGDVVFSVSSRTLKTISNFVWSGSARYATHDLHAGNSNHGYGRYRWTILSHKTKAEHYDGHGNIISATLSISLQEYLR